MTVVVVAPVVEEGIIAMLIPIGVWCDVCQLVSRDVVEASSVIMRRRLGATDSAIRSVCVW